MLPVSINRELLKIWLKVIGHPNKKIWIVFDNLFQAQIVWLAGNVRVSMGLLVQRILSGGAVAGVRAEFVFYD